MSATVRVLRVGVIGMGLMGYRHARAYRSIPGIALAGLAEIDAAAGARAAAEFGVACHADWQALLEQKLDAISICLPDNLHLQATLAALSRGLAVLLEKPLATDPDEAEQIAQAAQGRILLVGHMLRLDPRYHQGRRLLLAGRIGRPLHLTTRRSSAIGAAARYGASTSLVWHVAIHDIDLVRWFMQREIVEVYAHGVSRRLRDVGHYDALLALLRFADGTPCAMECSWVLPEHLGTALDARLDVLGEAGRIEIQGFEQGLRVTDATSIGFPDTTRWGEYEDGTPYGILMAEIAHFIGCVREGCPPAVTAQDALRTVQVAAAMERSIREGVPVHVNNSGIRGNG